MRERREMQMGTSAPTQNVQAGRKISDVCGNSMTFRNRSTKVKILCAFSCKSITLLSSTINLPVPSLPTNILRLVYERGDILQNLLFKHLTSPHKPMYVPPWYMVSHRTSGTNTEGGVGISFLALPWVAMEHGHVPRLAEEET